MHVIYYTIRYTIIKKILLLSVIFLLHFQLAVTLLLSAAPSSFFYLLMQFRGHIGTDYEEHCF